MEPLTLSPPDGDLFHAPQEKGYFMLNDFLRFVREGEGRKWRRRVGTPRQPLLPSRQTALSSGEEIPGACLVEHLPIVTLKAVHCHNNGANILCCQPITTVPRLEIHCHEETNVFIRPAMCF